MKNIYKTIMGLFFVLLSSQIVFSQVPNDLQGSFTIIKSVPSTAMEKIDIFKDKIEVRVGETVVERFFYKEKKGEFYILEVVKLQITSLSQMPENRLPKLIQVKVEDQENNLKKLTIHHVSGVVQELIMRK